MFLCLQYHFPRMSSLRSFPFLTADMLSSPVRWPPMFHRLQYRFPCMSSPHSFPLLTTIWHIVTSSPLSPNVLPFAVPLYPYVVFTLISIFNCNLTHCPLQTTTAGSLAPLANCAASLLGTAADSLSAVRPLCIRFCSRNGGPDLLPSLCLQDAGCASALQAFTCDNQCPIDPPWFGLGFVLFDLNSAFILSVSITSFLSHVLWLR